MRMSDNESVLPCPAGGSGPFTVKVEVVETELLEAVSSDWVYRMVAAMTAALLLGTIFHGF